MSQLQLHAKNNDFATSFQNAKPFCHLVIDNLLSPEFCRKLANDFPRFESDKAVSELGTEGYKAVHTNLLQLGPAYESLDKLIRSEEFLNLVTRWTGIPDLLYDSEYVGGGTHENLNGQELDPHIDFNYHPTTALHRRLNLILFLNREWEESWGGGLDFHRDPWDPESDQVISITPVFNRCVLFETNEHSWHGFRQIVLPKDKRHISRRTIAVYFYTRERPIAEVATEHSTVYVPRAMPSHIRPGYTLSQEDCDNLRTRHTRNIHQIRFLYDMLARRAHSPDESGFSPKTLLSEIAHMRQKIAYLAQQNKAQESEIELRKNVLSQVESSRSLRVGRLMTWPLRVLRRLKCVF